MKTRLGSNIVYQTVYQVLAIITPLITAPYISRVLGAEGLGTFSFTLTNANYFVLFAMLGVSDYGNRTIASVQGDKKERSKAFWNIYTTQSTLTLLMVIMYSLFIIFFMKATFAVCLVQGLWIVNCLFDVNWYFFGVEKFRLTVIRNIIIKVLTVVAILVLVNKTTGVIGYALIMSLGTVLSNLAIIPFLKNEIEFVAPSLSEMKRHIGPNMILFVPVLASSVFHYMDKTMLGSLGGLVELGYYTNSDKIVQIPIGIINGLGTVFLPRITVMRKENTADDVKLLLKRAFALYSFIIMALAFGLSGIAREFSPLFFGLGFDACVFLIILFSPVLVVKSYSCFVRTNILIPYNREKQYTIAVIIGAIVNLIVNLLLIPKYGAIGAVIGTFFAEFAVCGVQLYKLPIGLRFKDVVFTIIPYLISGVIMFAVIRGVATVNLAPVLIVLSEIIIGAVVYISLSFVFGKLTKQESVISILKQ